MQYISYQDHTVYSGDREHWRDISVMSERPGPDYVPVIEDGEHVGWNHQPQSVEPPDSITARQLRIGLVLAEWITEAEAVAWRKGDALPAPVQAVIDAMPAEQRFIAEETAFSMSVAERGNPLLFSAAQAVMPDATEQEISDALDQAFREWSQL